MGEKKIDGKRRKWESTGRGEAAPLSLLGLTSPCYRQFNNCSLYCNNTGLYYHRWFQFLQQCPSYARQIKGGLITDRFRLPSAWLHWLVMTLFSWSELYLGSANVWVVWSTGYKRCQGKTLTINENIRKIIYLLAWRGIKQLKTIPNSKIRRLPLVSCQ